MPRRTYDIMSLLHLWNSILFMLTAVRTTGNTFNGTEKDIMHAIAGNPFIIRTWSMIDLTLFITIKKDSITIFTMSMGAGIDRNSTVQNSRMMPIYNQTRLSLLLNNVSKEDGGIYEMRESFYTDNNEAEADTYDRKDGTWYLEIYVLGPSEIKQGYVGGNISMEFERSINHSTLYNYDELGALLAGTTCCVLTDSSLYGRLRCANDDSGRMYKITIVNVSQRDAGLYKIDPERNETGRCFLSIKDSPTCAAVGDNITIGWFYNQQGIKRKFRVIHPNQGVMMLLHQTNSPQIKSNFQHRLLYNGDILQSFMLFTLLNIGQSDAGLYTIETLHGNTIPGSKELIVDGTYTTCGGKQTTLDDVTANISVTKQEVVTVQPMERQCQVPVYVIPVTIGVFAVINLMMCFLIWIRLKKANSIEAERHQVLAKHDTDLYITPIASERPQSLLIPPNEDVRMDHTTISQNAHVEKSTGVLHMAYSPCMNGYEMIHMSSNDEFQNTLHNNDSDAESHESSTTPFRDESDYLTVEFVMESAV